MLLAATLLFAAAVRVRLAPMPLERDEGEYAYAGQLILQGVPPYQLAYNMKFPGTYYAYAAVMTVFGQTATGVRLGLLLVNALTVLLVFAIGRRLLGSLGGTVAAIAFAILSLDVWVMGVFAHATHFVLLPALAGLWLLLRTPARQRAPWLLASGALLGAAILVKQHAFTFLPLGALVLWFGGEGPARALRTRWFELGLLALGALLPLIVVCAVFAWQGVLDSFWFWTFQYAREYVTELPISTFIPHLSRGLAKVTRVTAPLWMLGAFGFVALWAVHWGRKERTFLSALLLASFIAVCPGLYFREHYFILMLPAVALLAGVAMASLAALLERIEPVRGAPAIAAAGFLALTLALIARQQDYLFHESPQALSRARYGANPFIESVAIADYIKARTQPGDRIAVLGSEPQIYFYAGRRSATGYIYMYPLAERQRYAARMQEEMVQQIESSQPEYVVLVQIATSWLPATSMARIEQWANGFTSQCYELVGLADLASSDGTKFAWDENVAAYQPRSKHLIYVFRRKSAAPCDSSP